MIQDLKHAVRVLLQTKGWSAVVLISLALGIGANTALFSGVNGLLLRTISIPHPETLVRLRHAGKNDMRTSSSGYGFNGKTASGEDIRESTSYQIYQTLRAANQTLEDIAASAPLGNLNVVVDAKAELALALIVSGNYFRVLDVPAKIGRVLTPEDDVPSASPAAVISFGYWQKRFGGQASVIGKVVTINTVPVTIVGVTPQEYSGIQNLTNAAHDIVVPLAFDDRFRAATGSISRIKDGTYWWLQMTGRLKPGVTSQQVLGNLEGPFQAAAQATWTSYLGSLKPEERAQSRNQNRTAVPHLLVDSASRGIYGVNTDTMQSAKLLSIVVGLMLVIVCANVANLLLSRATARHKEISVRMSLGATRSRLVRQLLTESLLLATLGGALGIIIGYWARQLLPFADTAPMDSHVLAFVAALCMTSGVAFGLVPALRATGDDLSGAMKETSRNISRSRTFLTKSLVVIQVTISLVVLIGAGLFLRTLQNLRQVDNGFNSRNLVVFSVNPSMTGYDAPRVARLFERLEQDLQGIPGVRAVSRSNVMPLSGSENTTDMYIQGKPPTSVHGLELWMMNVSPEFFETLEIPLVRGRNLDVRDTLPKAPQVVVINEAAARQYFPGEDPIGKRWGYSLEQSGDIEIVGIVRDIKYNRVREAAPPTAFSPYPQQRVTTATFQIRTAGDPTPFMKTIRETVQREDSNLPIVRMTTETDLIEGRFEQERFFALSYTLFGGLALVLASIGLFGVMSYSVARRTNEIGIRMALGAEKQDVLRMVLGESLLMVSMGIVVGLGTALAAGRFIATMLFGLSPSDGLTIGAAVAVMLTVSFLAGYLPARRAARVDPMVALHYE